MNEVNLFSQRVRRLSMFLIGVLSLLFGGIILGENFDLNQCIILSIAAVCGVMLLYDVKNKLPNENWFKILIWFLKIKSNALFVWILLVLFPFAFKYLSILSFVLLTVIMVLGVLYSLPHRIGKITFKLKNILFLKNILIGLAWGGLVIVGAGSIHSQVLYLAGFMMLQVFLGSIIRDLADVKSDNSNGVNSLPVAFGISNTIWIMHFINLLSLLFLFRQNDFQSNAVIFVLVTWRLLNLIFIKVFGVNKHLIQTFNLSTCYLFFIILFIQHYYELN
ncbi:hypothetical protein DNU06_14385 [Putridiphycobacter roseus]|uniref:Prenyltransferase n=2 Tax=Putridiphycobacter roseus TaxID=2219161 RepID=A0A2W1MVM1_9FLAO|nr:hypothetical protein DNU06_14385 [Putridiphycobacter roseus]